MKDAIRSYLLATSANPDVRQLGDDESLLELGVIDSAAMVDLIAHLEKTYGIQVDEDDMTPENFDTVNSIAAYVQSRSD
jgi:acyl carrier protein